jgi:hypothetical protein
LDINEALSEIRETIMLYNSTSSDDLSVHYANEIIERFEALDAWLSAKGFLPSDWNR